MTSDWLSPQQASGGKQLGSGQAIAQDLRTIKLRDVALEIREYLRCNLLSHLKLIVRKPWAIA